MAPFRIRVNSICRGAIQTHSSTEAWNTPEADAPLMTLVPCQRIGEPEVIGASPPSSHLVKPAKSPAPAFS